MITNLDLLVTAIWLVIVFIGGEILMKKYPKLRESYNMYVWVHMSLAIAVILLLWLSMNVIGGISNAF